MDTPTNSPPAITSDVLSVLGKLATSNSDFSSYHGSRLLVQYYNRDVRGHTHLHPMEDVSCMGLIEAQCGLHALAAGQ